MAIELKTQYPNLANVVIGEGVDSVKSAADTLLKVALLSASSSKAMPDDERLRVENWFQARTNFSAVRICINAPAPPQERVKRR